MSLTYKQQFNKKFNQPLNQPNSKEDMVKLTGIKKKILDEIFDRGVGARKTNLRSVRIKGTFKKSPNLRKYPSSKRLTPEQWAIARIYSTIMNYYHFKKTGNEKAAFKSDRDLFEKYQPNLI